LLNGEKFNLTLTFKRAGTVKVVVNVEELTPNNKSIDSTNDSMTKPTQQDSVDAAHSHH
jgi:copper(I)-binding protein